jgi:hypothetical protein
MSIKSGENLKNVLFAKCSTLFLDIFFKYICYYALHCKNCNVSFCFYNKTGEKLLSQNVTLSSDNAFLHFFTKYGNTVVRHPFMNNIKIDLRQCTMCAVRILAEV